jgi:hypothetical protein
MKTRFRYGEAIRIPRFDSVSDDLKVHSVRHPIEDTALRDNKNSLAIGFRLTHKSGRNLLLFR